MKRVFLMVCVAFAVVSGLGCSHYYKIRDPASGTVYFTNDYDNKSGGAIRFKDVVTQQQVTLSASEVMKITKDEYKANVHGR